MAQGRSSACLSIALLLVCCVAYVQATDFVVGGADKWTMPGLFNTFNSTYLQTWANEQKFKVGDSLTFEYNTTFHDVLQVSQADYAACTLTSPIETYKTGDDTVPIKTAGSLYFICGTPHHCLNGQKVAINATATSSSPSPGSNAAFGSSISCLQILLAVSSALIASLAVC